MAGRGSRARGAAAAKQGVREFVKHDGSLSGFDLPPADEVLPPYKDVPQVSWHPMTVRTWNAWRSSPQAARMVTEVDWLYLLDTMMMHHRMWVSGNFESMAEVRQRLGQFGVTPSDRARLKFEVESPEEYPVGNESAKDAPVTDISSERRKRLAGG